MRVAAGRITIPPTRTHALCISDYDVFSDPSSKRRGRRTNPSFHDVRCRRQPRPGRKLVCFRDRAGWPRQGRGGGGARRDRTDDLMLAKHALYQLSYGPLLQETGFSWEPSSIRVLPARGVTRSVVGPGRLELPTSRLSGVCSNQLSYRPLKRHIQAIATYSGPRYAIAPQPHRLQCHAERETKTATLCYLHSVCERTNRA